MKTPKMRQIFTYLVWIILSFLFWGLAKIIPRIFVNPWFFSLAFLYILFLPGWALAQLLRLSFQSITQQLLFSFVLGLGFYFTVNFLAIFAGISLGVLSWVVLILISILFVSAFILNWVKPTKNDKISGSLLRLDNIFYFLPVIFGGFVLWLLSVLGPNLNGDPYLHISIIRKAFDGVSLSTRNLALTKTSLINPAYVYPVWHIFLGLVSKFFSVSIFTTWANIIYPLTALSFLAWYYFARIIFEKKSWAIFAVTLTMIFMVYTGPGYLFSRLGVPDTLAQLLLLPLSLALTLQYIFEGGSRKILLLIFLTAFMLLVLHGPHYFYLIILVLFFGLFYVLLLFKDSDYKQVLGRIIKVFLLELAALIILATVIELRSKTLIVAILEFYKSSGGVIFSTSFSKFGLLYKYGYFLLPLTFIFIKSKKILFLIVSLLLTPLIYWSPLKIIFNKTLSGVFTERLLANTSFYFFIFVLVFGLVIYLLSLLISKLPTNWRMVANFILVIIFGLLVLLEVRSHQISDFVYNIFYAKTTNAFVSIYSWWFLITGLILGVVLFFCFPKHRQLSKLEFKDLLAAFCLMLIFSFVLISPSFVNAAGVLKKPRPQTVEGYFLYLVNNDNKAVEFAKNEIPPKSVVLSNSNASKGLSTLLDVYLAYNVGSAYDKKFKWVFNNQNSDEVKTEIVTDPKWAIDYIYLVNPSLENIYFKAHPEIYQKIYSGQTEIYKIIK